MRVTYAKESRASALELAAALTELGLDGTPVRQNGGTLIGDVNWGRNRADTALNPDISNVTNKRVMRELFAQHDVPMPTLYTPAEAAELIEDSGDEPVHLIGRPDRHTRGRGFWTITNQASLLLALRGTAKKSAATHFMEYVEADHEYRVHIFKGKSIRISEKSFTGAVEAGKPNHNEYTTIKPTANVRHVRQAAKEAISAVGLDFGAVDILATEDDCWVLEANAAPGLGGSMPRAYAEAIKKWQEEQ